MEVYYIICGILLVVLVAALIIIGRRARKTILDGPGMVNDYHQISPAEVLSLMQRNKDFVIVDARSEEEFEKGHIEGAICIPNESIGAERPDALPDSHRQILVYGDGGPGSKEAARKLFDLGYANVCEFGGIGEPEWQGRTVSGRDDVEDYEAIRPRAVLVIDVGEKRFYASLESNAAVSAFVEKLNPAPLKIEMGDSENGEMSGLLPWSLPDAGKRISAVAGDFILREGNRIALCYDENEDNFTRLARIGNVSKEEILDAFGNSGGPVSASFSLEWGE